MIVRHLLVGTEVVTLQLLLGSRLGDGHEHRVPHLVLVHVPEEFLGLEEVTFAVQNDHTPSQLPHPVVMTVSGVALHVPFHVEGGVELFQKQSFQELPFLRLGGVDEPVFGDNLIADDARVGDEVRDAMCRQERQRVLLVDSRCDVLMGTAAGKENEK